MAIDSPERPRLRQRFRKTNSCAPDATWEAHIWHGLNDIIFRHQGLTESLGKLSHLMIAPDMVSAGSPLRGRRGQLRIGRFG